MEKTRARSKRRFFVLKHKLFKAFPLNLSPEWQTKLRPFLQQQRQLLQRKLRDSHQRRHVFLQYPAEENFNRAETERFLTAWLDASQSAQASLQQIFLEAAEQFRPTNENA